jgi:hypothetical protein
MPLTNAGKAIALNALKGIDPGASYITHASLHSAEPDSNGSDEISGGSPAYARKAISWTTATSDDLDSSNQPVFDVPGSTTITHVGFWDDATSGAFLGYAAITQETFGGQGTYTLTDADVLLNDA